MSSAVSADPAAAKAERNGCRLAGEAANDRQRVSSGEAHSFAKEGKAVLRPSDNRRSGASASENLSSFEVQGTGGTGGTPLKTNGFSRSPNRAPRGNAENRLDFEAINRAAMAVLPALLARWAPGGRYRGHEYVTRNPRRIDRRPGSFCINTRTGKWADFATNDRGGDPISLAAYLSGSGQVEAARGLARMLGVRHD